MMYNLISFLPSHKADFMVKHNRTPTLGVDITAKCVEITKRFHARTITKVSAILELQESIPRENETTHREALRAYIRVFDNFERIRERVTPVKAVGGGEDNQGVEDAVDEEENTVGTNKRAQSKSTDSEDGSIK
jgi:Icc-related predicted phosphoesterase